jgi:hypothetical protein
MNNIFYFSVSVKTNKIPETYPEPEQPIISKVENMAVANDMSKKCIPLFVLRKKINPLDFSTELKNITILPECYSKSWLDLHLKNYGKELEPRKRIVWARGEADIRLLINFEKYEAADDAGRMQILIDTIIDSIKVIKEMCDKKKKHFDADGMIKRINDIIAEEKIFERLDEITNNSTYKPN